jgi:phosphoglycolate phosphatase
MLKAAIFDKDGTLFDFRATWGGWTRSVIQTLADKGADAEALARVLGYDLAMGQFDKSSPVIASTSETLAEIILPFAPDLTKDQLLLRLSELSQQAPQVPVGPLPAIFAALKARGLVIGLATNDTETAAVAHLKGAGVFELFDFVAGFDSGHGGKPAPGQLLAFAKQTGIQPGQIVMVGDSLHDMHAGAAAGMARAAVLTGMAETEDLAPDADVVLADISQLAGWIDQQNQL